jgi:hypothetical protein
MSLSALQTTLCKDKFDFSIYFDEIGKGTANVGT